MFQKPKNINAAYVELRRIAIAAICSCAFMALVAQAYNHAKIKRMQNQIYALSDIKRKQTHPLFDKENLKAEVKHQIRAFHHYIFKLNSDTARVDQSIARAYELTFNGNTSQEFSIDSIRVNLNKAPYSFRCYATLKRIRRRGNLTHNLLSTGYLKTTAGNHQNPHGLQLKNWKLIQNIAPYQVQPITDKSY